MLSPVLGGTVFYTHIIPYFYGEYSTKHNSQSFMEPGLHSSLALLFSFYFIVQHKLCRIQNRFGWGKLR